MRTSPWGCPTAGGHPGWLGGLWGWSELWFAVFCGGQKSGNYIIAPSSGDVVTRACVARYFQWWRVFIVSLRRMDIRRRRTALRGHIGLILSDLR